MTNGYPLAPDVSFPARMRSLRIRGQLPEVTTFALGGFTAERAAKWILQKSHAHPADFTVIQLGSTDASVPVRTRFRRPSKQPASSSLNPPVPVPSGGSGSSDPPAPSGWFSGFQWFCEGIIRGLFGLQPVVPADDYARAVSRLSEEISKHSTTLVLSPFVMGDFYSNRHARNHSSELRQILSGIPGVIFVDAFDVLMAYPRKQVLLSDGFHLSSFGHEVIAGELCRVIAGLWESGSDQTISAV